MNDQETLIDLYDQLEEHLKHRDRLAVYILLYGAALMALSALPSRAWRMGGGTAFYVTLGVVTLFMGAVGLSLLVRFIINMKEIRELREEIAYFKATATYADTDKPKRKTRYTIGDDGELVPVEYEEHEEHHASRIRL